MPIWSFPRLTPIRPRCPPWASASPLPATTPSPSSIHPCSMVGAAWAPNSASSRRSAARDRDALLYGECGGFMVLGETLIDKAGQGHAMTGLLPVTTRIDRPKRILGYRRLIQSGTLPWPGHLNGHEFHYSSAKQSRLAPLFAATDARGDPLPPMGAAINRV